MLKYLGLNNLEELHAEVPEAIKLKGRMNIPEAMPSELALKRHVSGIMARNKTCEEALNFLGAGCWQHHVPAVCDEINSRGEFLTAYGGESYNDAGRFQALFEFESLMAELVDMDVCNVPTMDWGQAAATGVRMACRVSGRNSVIVPKTVGPERYAIMRNYCSPDLKFLEADYDEQTGLMDLDSLKSLLSDKIGCVYFENPGFLGIVETQGKQIADLAHEAGAVVVVGVDPSSLGVLAPPSSYGADITVGDAQPLGIHMNYGGGQCGFICTRDEEKFVMEYPSRLFGIAPTETPGEFGFADVAYDRTSFGHHREHGKEYVGTQTALWGITAGSYLALMGPAGMKELGQNIVQKTLYAAKKIGEIPGLSVRFKSFCFKEIAVDFNKSGKTAAEVNKKLLEQDIFGGYDLSKDFPALGQCALYAFTEIHTKQDIDRLAKALEGACR
jgi:glycine dehydrogenase subunit 1